MHVVHKKLYNMCKFILLISMFILNQMQLPHRTLTATVFQHSHHNQVNPIIVSIEAAKFKNIISCKTLKVCYIGLFDT